MSVNSAPFPEALDAIVKATQYKAGWTLSLVDGYDRGQDCVGLTLVINIRCPNSYHPDAMPINVNHLFPVPAASYNESSWRRWLFEQILLVERHEAMEFFQIDGERPFAPNHGPGHDPYTIREVTTDEDRRTSFRGEVKS